MMTTLRTLPAVALGLLLLLGVPGLARAQYDFHSFDYPEAVETYADGNSTHEIVGEYVDKDGNTHGFVWNKDDFSSPHIDPFDAPDAVGDTSINGINARGDRVGRYTDTAGKSFGYFLSKKGDFKTIDAPGARFTQAFFLNAQGQVVGYYVDAKTRVRHGFLWSKGDFTTTSIDVKSAGPGGTAAVGINEPGDIVGFYRDGAPPPAVHHFHGFLLSGGVYTLFDVPDANGGDTVPQGINNRGQIVGYYTDADGTDHGFVLSDGVYKTINVPDALWTDIYSINAKGEIVGAYGDADGVHVHGFQGTPTHK